MKIDVPSYYKPIKIGDIVCHMEFGICMIIFDSEEENLNGNKYSYKLLNMETGLIENGYLSLEAATMNCYILISNEDLILSSIDEKSKSTKENENE